MVAYFGVLAAVLSPAMPVAMVTTMQASNMPAVIIGRVGPTREGRGTDGRTRRVVPLPDVNVAVFVV